LRTNYAFSGGQNKRKLTVVTLSRLHDFVSVKTCNRTNVIQFLNKLTGKYSERKQLSWRSCGVSGHRRDHMRKLLISTLAAVLVVSFAVSAEAAKQKVSAEVQASCKAQAAKKYSAIHFVKRRDFVNNCVAQHAKAAAPKAAKPATTGQAPKATTGQAPKQAQ
jgi:hypothetical protein